MSVEDHTEQQNAASTILSAIPAYITAPIDTSTPANDIATSFYPKTVSFWPSTLSDTKTQPEAATPSEVATQPDADTQPSAEIPTDFSTTVSQLSPTLIEEATAPETAVATYYPATQPDDATASDSTAALYATTGPKATVSTNYRSTAPETAVATYYPATQPDAETVSDVATVSMASASINYRPTTPKTTTATYVTASEARDSFSTTDGTATSANRDPVVVGSSAATDNDSVTADLEPALAVVYLEARNLELKTRRGMVFSGVNLQVSLGQVVAVRGCSGSGKTSLLLVLSGRMKSTGGTLRVGQYQLPKQRAKVERQVGLSFFKGLNDLQDSLTAAFAVGAEFELYGRKPHREDAAHYLRAWGLRDEANIRIKDLTAKKRAQLGIALAFVGQPQVVVVDDIEDQLTKSQSEDLLSLLSRAARKYNTAVVVGVTERDLAALADSCIYLTKEGEWLPWHSKD